MASSADLTPFCASQVIYFDDLTPSWSDSLIVLDPRWLANMFRSIITRRYLVRIKRPYAAQRVHASPDSNPHT